MAESSGQSSSIGTQGIINIGSRIAHQTNYINISPECTNLLRPEVIYTILAKRKPVPPMERSIHGRGTAASEKGACASQTSANDPGFSVDGSEGSIFLYKLREKLKKQEITKSDVEKMFDALDVGRSSTQRPSNVDELFSVLMQKGRLREDDVIYLQCLLWVVGKKNVMEVVAAEALRHQQNYHRTISHLATSVELKNGYRSIYFHIKVPILQVTAERLKKLETTVATLLGISPDFVAVAEVKLGSSAWVSVMVPEEAYKTLVEALRDEKIKQYFASLGVDKTSTSDVTSTTSAAGAEEPDQNKKRKRGAAGERPAPHTREATRVGEAKEKEIVRVLPPLNGTNHVSSKRLKTTRASAAKEGGR